MNILLVSQDNSQLVMSGGKHVHQQAIIASWELAGHDVRCCFPHDGEVKLSLLSRLLFRTTRSWSSYPIRYFSRYLILLERKIVKSIKEVFSEWSPDVISVQDPLSAVALNNALNQLGLLEKPKVTMTLHGYYTWEMFNYGYYGDKNLESIEEIGFRLEREALNVVDGVITVDTRIEKYLRDYFSYSGKVNVVFNAIDLTPFQNAVVEQRGESDRWVLLVTRRMVLKNGVEVALKAFSDVVKRKGNVELVMVGDGPELSRLKSLAKKLNVDDKINFVGNVDHEEVHRYYLSSDILLMPSIPSDNIEEATSLSMLEGMAAGSIVICSAIGGMKEIVRNGVNGYLVKPNNQEDLASKIIEVIEDTDTSRFALVQRAKEYVWESHASDKHADKILSIMGSS